MHVVNPERESSIANQFTRSLTLTHNWAEDNYDITLVFLLFPLFVVHVDVSSNMWFTRCKALCGLFPSVKLCRVCVQDCVFKGRLFHKKTAD